MHQTSINIRRVVVLVALLFGLVVAVAAAVTGTDVTTMAGDTNLLTEKPVITYEG